MSLTLSQRIAVIGAGAMGRDIAAVAARAGHEVYIFDQDHHAAAAAPARIAADWQTLVTRGKWSAADSQAAQQRLRPISQLAELADAALVIEAIVEQLAAKQSLFNQLEQYIDPDAILASNTSSLSITALAAGLQHPQRVAGLHFFNPATRMPLVEVIHGLATDPAVLRTLLSTAQAWGKRPVAVASAPGFIVNRVARPYYAEALRLLNEQASNVATLDALLREAGGFAMGPLELMDFIGHDVNFAVTQSVYHATYQDARFQPSLIQQELVAAGWLGRKSGRGFYDYHAEAVPPSISSETHQPAPSKVQVHGDLGIATPLLKRLAAAGITLEQQATSSKQGWLSCGDMRLALSDGRTATQRAADSGYPHWALFDLALDYTQTPRLALAVADQASPATLAHACGLLQAANINVSRIDDVAGMVVLRTVAMLINEAADALQQGLASATDIDQAMRDGTHYPLGPLAWADQLGLANIVTVLTALHAHYGDNRYRIAPLLRRLAYQQGQFHAPH